MSNKEQKKELVSNINMLMDVAGNNNYRDIKKRLNEYLKKIEDDKFIITVIGEIKRGKSTLINTLIGEDILPTDVIPTTATINLIKYGTEPKITIRKSDNSTQTLPFNKKEMEKYTGLVDFDPKTIKYIEIEYPKEFLQNGILLVDTPGVNELSNQRMEVTYGYIPISDACIFLINAQQAISRTEMTFLNESVLKSSLSKIFFVVNRIDKIDEDEIEEFKEDIKEKLKENLNADERVYFLSSSMGLKAKLDNNAELLKESGFSTFEDDLISFVLSDKKVDTQISNMKKQKQIFIDEILNSIKFDIDTLNKPSDELIKMLENLKNIKVQKEEIFSKLMIYIDEQVENMIIGIRKSSIKTGKKLLEELTHEITTFSGDFKKLAEEKLPYILKTRITSWIDISQPNIDLYISTISKKSMDAFYRYLSKAPILQAILDKNNDVKVETVEFDSSGIANQKITENATTLAGIGLGVLVFGGPIAMIVGMMGGRYFSDQIKKKREDDYKTQMIPELEAALQYSFAKATDDAIGRITNYFDVLKTSLNNNFLGLMDEIKISIENAVDMNRDDEDQKRINIGKLKEIINELEEI